jgi:hypothetical protein
MSSWAPPSLPREGVWAIAISYFVFMAYMLLIVQQIFLGIMVGALLVFGYAGWRFLVTFEAIADALHRIADQREQE